MRLECKDYIIVTKQTTLTFTFCGETSMKKIFAGITSIILCASLLLTSCTSSEKKKDDKDDLDEAVVEVLDGYFKQVKKGSFSKAEKYTESSSFSELDLTSDESEVVNALLSTASYEITKTDTNEKKGEGKATIKLTYADVSSIIDGIDGQADADFLIDKIKEKNAKTTKKTVKVNLVYEDDEWKIEDDSPIYDALLSSLDDISYCLDPIEPTVPISSEEPTTTTSEEPTTTTEEPTTSTEDTSATSEESSSDPTGTSANPPSGDKQVKYGAELDKMLKDFGFTVEDEVDEGVTGKCYSYDEDFVFMYFETNDATKSKQLNDYFRTELLALEPDCEDVKITTYLKTENIYLIKAKSQEDHSFDFYIYYDEDIVLIAGVNEFPNADVSWTYYKLIQDVGLWNFDLGDDGP